MVKSIFIKGKNKKKSKTLVPQSLCQNQKKILLIRKLENYGADAVTIYFIEKTPV